MMLPAAGLAGVGVFMMAKSVNSVVFMSKLDTNGDAFPIHQENSQNYRLELPS